MIKEIFIIEDIKWYESLAEIEIGKVV